METFCNAFWNRFAISKHKLLVWFGIPLGFGLLAYDPECPMPQMLPGVVSLFVIFFFFRAIWVLSTLSCEALRARWRRINGHPPEDT